MKQFRLERGFTIVELLVVLVVMGILTGMIYFAIQTWRSDTDQVQMKNDLGAMKSAVDQYRNFNNQYPALLEPPQPPPPAPPIDPIYKSSKDVIITYFYRSADDSYCANATHKRSTALKFSIDSRDGNLKTGTCAP